MKIASHLDLPVIADMEAMFQLAVTDLGPLSNPYTDVGASGMLGSLRVCVRVAHYAGMCPHDETLMLLCWAKRPNTLGQ